MVFAQRQEHELVDLLEIENCQTLLDVGGGTGRVSVLFKNTTKKIFIADTAINMLQLARDKGLATVVSESEHLPFPDQIFNRIIMVDTFHHVKDQRQSLDEMWRLLTPRGKMVIEEPDIQHLLVKLIALGERLLLMRSQFKKPQAIVEMCQFVPHSDVKLIRRKGFAWIIITKKEID